MRPGDAGGLGGALAGMYSPRWIMGTAAVMVLLTALVPGMGLRRSIAAHVGAERPAQSG